MTNIIASNASTLCVLTVTFAVTQRTSPASPSSGLPPPPFAPVAHHQMGRRYRVEIEDGGVTSVDVRHAITDDSWQASFSMLTWTAALQRQMCDPCQCIVQGVPRLDDAAEISPRRLAPVPPLTLDAAECSISASGTYMLIFGRSDKVAVATVTHVLDPYICCGLPRPWRVQQSYTRSMEHSVIPLVQDDECFAACVVDLSSSRPGPEGDAECESFPVDPGLFCSHPGLLILQVTRAADATSHPARDHILRTIASCACLQFLLGAAASVACCSYVSNEVQASWHPSSNLHFAVLTSDNIWRLYNVLSLSQPVRRWPLQGLVALAIMRKYCTSFNGHRVLQGGVLLNCRSNASTCACGRSGRSAWQQPRAGRQPLLLSALEASGVLACAHFSLELIMPN